MYLIDKITFVKQILPPQKRENWRVNMICVLVSPLFKLIELLIEYKHEKLSEINLNSQTIVLENHLQQVFETSNLFLGIDNEGGVVYIPTSWDNKKRAEVKAVIDKYIMLGCNYKIR